MSVYKILTVYDSIYEFAYNLLEDTDYTRRSALNSLKKKFPKEQRIRLLKILEIAEQNHNSCKECYV